MPHYSHSHAPGEQYAWLCVFTLQGCVQDAWLCRGSPVTFQPSLKQVQIYACLNMHLEHTMNPCQGSLSTCHDSNAMDQFIHFLDPHPNWTHQPNVPSQVPFHKGIHHRLYQTMSCGYIFILDVRESFLNWSAAAWRTAPGKPDWWSWFAPNNATNPAAIVMKRFSLVRLYHHWDAAIHYGVQLAQYCDQNLSCNAISQRSPLCAHLP